MGDRRRKPRPVYGRVTPSRQPFVCGLPIAKVATNDLEWVLRLAVTRPCIDTVESMEAIIREHLSRVANG